MCFLKPLKVKEIKNNIVLLENGIKAYYNGKTQEFKEGDLVLVFGNLVIEKIDQKSKRKEQNLNQN